MRYNLIPLLLLGSLLSPLTAQADLIGHTVSGTLQGKPDLMTTTQFASPTIVRDPGVEFTGVLSNPYTHDGFNVNTDIRASSFSIRVDYVGPSDAGGDSGFDINLTGLEGITDVSAAAGNPSGLSALTFTNTSISTSIGRFSFTKNVPLIYNFNIQLAPAAPAVPEPGSVALLVGLTTTGAGFLARRRKQARHAA